MSGCFACLPLPSLSSAPAWRLPTTDRRSASSSIRLAALPHRDVNVDTTVYVTGDIDIDRSRVCDVSSNSSYLSKDWRVYPRRAIRTISSHTDATFSLTSERVSTSRRPWCQPQLSCRRAHIPVNPGGAGDILHVRFTSASMIRATGHRSTSQLMRMLKSCDRIMLTVSPPRRRRRPC